MDYDKIPPEKMLEAVKAIVSHVDNALAELKAYQTNHEIKSKSEIARNAYLHGKLHGLAKAKREFEMRCPIEWTDSSR